jgi:multiple sugar transport system permease protein
MVGETTFEQVGRYAVIVAVAMIVLLPVYWMVNMSLKDKAEFAARPPTLVVEQPTTENYYDLLVTQRFYLKGINSVVVAAYALARFRLPRNLNYHLLFTMLTVRMFPPIVTVIPLFAFYNREILGFKLFDTWLGLGLVHGFTELPLVLWMMIGFFRDIPRDMEEAALVDGDSRFAVLRKIAIPLAAPGLAATFILVFISSWNEFLLALILTG